MNKRALTRHTQQVRVRNTEQDRVLLEAIPMPVWSHQGNGELLDCNSHWREYTGQTAAAAAGRGWLKALHPDDLAEITGRRQDASETGLPYEVECRLRRASDGSYRWHKARTIPMRNKQGRIRHWLVCAADIEDQKRAEETLSTGRDHVESQVQGRTAELLKINDALTSEITERRLAEENARKAEAKYRTLLEQIPAVIYTTPLDDSRSSTFISPQIETLLGLTPAAWQNDPDSWQKHLHPDDYARVMDELVSSFRRNEPFESEYRMLRTDKGIVWFRDRAEVVCDETGNPLFLQGVMLDITERKELERAIVEVSSREQTRIGLDLHDSLCQRLAGIAFMWKTVADKVAARQLPENNQVGEIGQLITAAIDEARGLAQGLCPVELENNDLGMALKELGSSVERLFAVSCTVRCQRAVRLADKAVALHLYRIAQEAVSNAIRHGKATHVRIDFVLKKRKHTLWIRDNGVGFPGEEHCKRGTGIRSMRYRAQIIGAMLTIEREAGGGTRVTCVCSRGKTST
jgi:PAS domain S-box-containing protein